MAQTTSQIVGIVRGRGRLCWTLLRHRKNRYERVGGEVARDLPADAGPVLAELLAALGKSPARAVLALPADKVLLRVLDLPTEADEELGSMVELQADNFCPFPVEQMAIAHECLSRGGGRSRVLVAAVQREALDALAAPLLQAGLVPERLDVDVLGRSRLFAAEALNEGRQGRHAALLVMEEASDLIVFEDAQPLFFRSLPEGRLDDPAFVEELAEELAYSLTAMESEWGGHGLRRLALWTEAPAPEAALEALRTGCAAPVEPFLLSSQPPLSEALAWQAQQGDHLNLAPAEWAEQRSGQALRKKLAIAAAVLGGVWLVAMALLFGASRGVQGRLAEVQKKVVERETAAADISLLKSRVEELEQRGDRSESVLESLRAVTMALPSGVDLSSFTFRKGEGVGLRGQAVQNTLVTEFVDALNGSGVFAESKLETIGSRMVQNQRVSEYRINANFQRSVTP